MKLPKIGLGWFGGLALLVTLGLPTSAWAQITLRITVQHLSVKKKPTAAEMRNPKAVQRETEKKTIDERTMSLEFGTPKELVLPNGSKMILNATSFDRETKQLKMHVRVQVQESGYEADMTIPENRRYPVNAGVYGKNGVLVVYLSPQGH
jgi:hypothetical protein